MVHVGGVVLVLCVAVLAFLIGLCVGEHLGLNQARLWILDNYELTPRENPQIKKPEVQLDLTNGEYDCLGTGC
jgi:hypothetical protein